MIEHIKRNKGFYIFVLGVVFNFIESIYFGRGTTIGFNSKATSIGEFICDDISIIVMILGAYLMGLKINTTK